MLPTEQGEFFAMVSKALSEYVKAPAPGELEAWWSTCRTYSLSQVDRALKEHAENQDDGKRPPRPVDIKRRINYGAPEGRGCAAADHTGRCQYPGVMSDGTGGDSAFWCPWHFNDRVGPDASRWIERSREIPWNEAQERRAARMRAESIRSPSVVNTAHAIALRHGNRPWQSSRLAVPAWMRDRLEQQEPGSDG